MPCGDRDAAGPALDRYRDRGRPADRVPAATIEDGVDWIRETVAALGVPGLAGLGIRPDMADDIVDEDARGE